MIKVCYTWGRCNVLWKDANWTWSECQLVDEVVGGIPSGGIPGEFAQPKWLNEEPLTNDEWKKKKTFIRLIRRIKGEPDFNEEKELRKDIKISMTDIKIVVSAVKGIDIQILEK